MSYICLLQERQTNLAQFIADAEQNCYNVVAVPLNYKELPLEFDRAPLNEKHTQNTYPDLLLTSDKWNERIITILSETIDCDSEDPVVRKNSEAVLKRDFSWAEHLQYGGFSMMKLKGPNNLNLARFFSRKIKGVALVQVPLYNSKVAQSVWRRDLTENEVLKLQNEDTWHWWNSFRKATDFNPKLKVVLEINEAEMPSVDVVLRWLGEPVEAVIIPSSIFISNRKNFPVLPKQWHDVLKMFTKAHVNFIVAAECNDQSLKCKAEYLIKFREINKDCHMLQTFEDVLETPLQPLYDNLDCYTYEIFEKDPVKYKIYQDAIDAALRDRVKDDELEEKLTVIMILGAGRGPLARAALNASKISNRKIRVYIIEKNPNAIRTLTAIAKKLWHDKDVHIFSKDMREFSPPEQADILVSELLGSFGDNELSPECLDCAQKLLKPDGISIPCKSVSFINPIMSQKLLNGVQQLIRTESREKASTSHVTAEYGFVVLLKNVYHIDKPLPLFEFVHPNREKIVDNTRHKAIKFKAELDCLLTGVGGYFECVLYKNLLLSINPDTHTPGMVSWFPMYFPFTEPIDVRKGQIIEIHFWRCVSKQKIWYEWCLASPTTTKVHNFADTKQKLHNQLKQSMSEIRNYLVANPIDQTHAIIVRF